MKNTIALMGWIALGVCSCRPRTSFATKSDLDPTIMTVMVQKERAGLGHARILVDNGRIASVYVHGWQYLLEIEKIDVARCPEEFRSAWSNYVAVWGQKLKQEHATESTLDAVSMWKGDFADLPAISRRIEPYDTETAWARCERVALEYGVDASKARLR